MYMSGIDQIVKYARPNRTILFYKTEKDPAEAVESLRRGLASILVAFYPMAGRVVDDGGRFALDCNDEGVEFVEAKCDLSFAELEQNDFYIRRLFRDLVGMDSREYSNHIGDPLVSVQVTSFLGGLTVGFAITHTAADGHSFWTFVRSIAEACQGKPLSVLPVHMRSVLKPDSFLLNKFPEMASEELTKNDAAPYVGSMEMNKGSPKENLMLISAEELRQKVINFSKGMLETLKKACCEDQKGFFSSFEALSAYLWKRLVMAQRLGDHVRVDFRVPLDVRGRMIPPLTPAFFGNAVVGLTVPTTAGELKAESIGATAARIRQGVREGDDAYIKKAIIAREKIDLRKLILGHVVLFNIRNASRFPVFEAADFGWGQPQAVRPPWEWREGELTWYPGRRPGSIDVIASLSNFTCTNFFSPDIYPNDPLGPHAFLQPEDAGVPLLYG